MNRRGFFASLAALAAGALLPVAKVRDQLGARGWIKTRFFTRKVIVFGAEPSYIAYIHPSLERDLREMCARGEWAQAWRAYRVARRENVCGYLPARLVWERFSIPRSLGSVGEIGSFDGIKIITQERIAA